MWWCKKIKKKIKLNFLSLLMNKDIGYYKINNEYFINIKMLNNLLIIV